MGGYGSGRRVSWATRDTTAGAFGLSINRLHRGGELRPGCWSSWTWSLRGQPTGSISVWAENGHVRLSYQSSVGEGQWETIEQCVRIEWTPCHFGGARPWFCCPGIGCGRRVGKLYGVGADFLCRHCHHLAYESQRENRAFRALRRAQTLRIRLGGSGSMGELFPEKPKGMHWRTYDRLRHRAQEAEERQFAFLGEYLDKP